ncbi:G patch domain-containing protein 3 [Sinocyclocheilus anshuiensis]|uniref:G patch domain-containing protein 3 n=1 Tax=Sinocyclocheilus anshuiensis TaxID=1608454 RepID=UPI0007B9584B|nr:PREDICTED: G patch domain-containing protein 3 [Sinocyclocheilus anshuiensis]
MAASEEVTFFVVNNIPALFRSAELRNYFSQFIETKGFACFHYRHRPELRVQSAGFTAVSSASSGRSSEGKAAGSCCCVVSVRSRESDRFVKMYSGNHWIDSKGNWLRRKCLIRRVRVSEQAEHNSFPYKTKAEMRRHVAQSEHFTLSDLKGLPELNPPSLMPAGNVGTPVCVFLELIQSCRLPPRLIRKLGLTFPKTGSSHRYGNVPYLYHNTALVSRAEESVFTAGGVEISGPGRLDTPTNSQTVDKDTPTNSQRVDKDTPTNSQRVDKDMSTNSQTVDKGTPTNSQTVDKDTPTNSQRVDKDTPTNSQRVDKGTPTNSQTVDKDTPTNSQRVDKGTPTNSQTVDKGTPTNSQTVDKDTPTNPQTIYKVTPTNSQTIDKDTPTNSQTVDKDTPTNSQRVYKVTPTNSQTIDKDTPTNSQTVDKDTPTNSQRVYKDTPTNSQADEEDPPSSPLVNQESQEAGSEEELSDPDDDDDRCEEWERHEALHEDVTSQERTKERLFEEEIELKWEKGGSGLVFYTDAQFWHEEEEGDFDEQTADDWDVDMSVYYDKDGGDMDARDYVRMRSERRLRDGLDGLPGRQQKIGSFERFTKGVGRRVMEKQGWRDGEGLGNSRMGIPEALENEGQHPNCKRGFGYHGEKLSSFLPLKKPRKDFHISTVYDEPKDMDKGDEVLRRQPSTSMKYR